LFCRKLKAGYFKFIRSAREISIELSRGRMRIEESERGEEKGGNEVPK